MNISNKLQELSEDTLHFGEVISHSENPSNADFVLACSLFSQYLNHQLEVINTKIRFQEIRPEIRLANAQLCMLNKLITPDNTTCLAANDADKDATHAWHNNVLNFFNQLQTLKKLAA